MFVWVQFCVSEYLLHCLFQPVNVYISLLLLKELFFFVVFVIVVMVVVAGKRQQRKLMSIINNTQGVADSK